MSVNTTVFVRQCLQRMQAGDAAARDEMIGRASERLRRLATGMFRDSDRLRRWIDTDDLLQTAVLRLMNSLAEVRPESPEHFFRLAATQMRRELIDLARHYFGRHGAGANEQLATPASTTTAAYDPAQPDSCEPRHLVHWTELHERIAALPSPERDVCELIWYHGLTQAETAELLDLNESKVRRAWVAARLRLRDAFQGDFPSA